MASTLGSEASSGAGWRTPGSRNDRIGFVGLGNMGIAMARNMVKFAAAEGLPQVTVWNRTASKAEPLVELGAKVAPDLRTLAATCDLIITSLSNDQAAEAIYAELFAGSDDQPSHEIGDGIRPGGRGRSTIFVETSTLYPDTVGKLERQARLRRHRYLLQCPPFGPPHMAATAQLVLVMSGETHARNHAARFLVPSIARKIISVGENVEAAAKFKLIGNSMILGTIELLAESLTLADKTGVGGEKLYSFIEEFFPAPSFIGYGKKMITDSFVGDAGFTLNGGIKDASHIRKLAESVSSPMPIVDIAHSHMLTARAAGGSSLDWSSLVAGQRIASGCHPFQRTRGLERYSEEAGGGPPTRPASPTSHVPRPERIS